MTAIDIYRINESAENYLVPIIYLIVKTFSAILYSAENVIGKIIFLYYFLSTFELLVWKAVIDFINLIIFSIPFVFIELLGKDEQQKTALK